MIIVTQVRTAKDWKKFINFPFELYKNNPYWVPPLKKEIQKKLTLETNPFWNHGKREIFIAEKNGKMAGRIVAIIDDNYNNLWNEKMGAFGFFECINDQAVANALFQQAESWLRRNQAKFIRGPLSPSQNDECGFLLDAYDQSPVFMMPYNPPYYVTLSEHYGFTKIKDLLAFHKPHQTPPDPQISLLADRLKRNPNITTRHVNFHNINTEIPLIKKLYNDCWIKNWGFSPMTDEEFDGMVTELRKVADPNLIWFAFYKGIPAGLAITLPNFNEILPCFNGRVTLWGILKALRKKRKITSTRAIVFGFKKEYRRLGLPALLYHCTEKEGLKRGYTWSELSWNLEDNNLINQFDEKVGGTVYKHYRIVQKKL